MKVVPIAIAIACVATSAISSEVLGVWRSETSEDGGYIHVEIAPCETDGAKLCGTIIEAFNEIPENADPARRAELLGKVMIRDMTPESANEWANGTIWAPDDDETYRSRMALNGNILHVSGCVLAGLICRGQEWTRIQ